MTEEQKIKKIKIIEQEFLNEISRIEKIRDKKIKEIEKDIDKRQVGKILQKIKGIL